MTTHSITRSIDTARSDVWDRIASHREWSELRPTVTKAYAVSGIPQAGRACRLSFADDAAVEVLGLRNEALREAVVRIAVRGDGDEAIVTASVTYRSASGAVGRLFDRLVRSRRITAALDSMLDDIEGATNEPAVVAPGVYGQVVYEAA